jgi:hypothetical protein
MVSEFDNLAKVALGEASLGDYMKAVARATGRVAGAAANVAGGAVKVAGGAYKALGGTQGGALLSKVGSGIQAAGKGLQKISSPSEVFALQRKKALPSKGDIITIIVPYVNGRSRFVVQSVAADPKSGINITAEPQENISDKFDSVIIKTSGDTGLQSGSTGITFMLGKTLSTLKPIQANAQRIDIDGVNTWRLVTVSKKSKAQKKQPVKNAQNKNVKAQSATSRQVVKKKKKRASSTSTKLKYNTNAPSPHTGQVAGTTNGQIYPPPGGITI